MAAIVTWKPDRKNCGSPLGPVYLNGEWDGYVGLGEAMGYARDHNTELEIVGPLAAYARGKEDHVSRKKIVKKQPKKRVSKKCSRATFEGLIEGFPTLEGVAALAWESYCRLSSKQQIAVMEAVNGEGKGEEPTEWIMAKFREAQERYH